VFVLATALPVQATSQRRSIYLDVLRDLINQGQLERTASLKKLAELRSSLGLDDADHQSAMQVLTSEDERLAAMSSEELSGLSLCRSAAAQEIEDLLRLQNSSILELDRLDSFALERLNRIQTESGLDHNTWSDLLSDFGPKSRFSERQLHQRQQTVINALARRQSLMVLTQRMPLAAPLVLSLDRQISRFLPDLVALIRSCLAAQDEERPDDACLTLLGSLSPSVLAFLASEDSTTVAINKWLDGVPVVPLRPFIPDLVPYPGTSSVCRSAINPPPGTQNCGNNGYGGLIIDATNAADQPGVVRTVCVDENNDGKLTATDANCPAAFSSSSPAQIVSNPSRTATVNTVKDFTPYRGYWAKGFDTMRVSPEGVVQLCNTRDENLTNTQAEPILSQVLVGGTAGCADISRFCYRSDYIPPDGSPIQRAYHCRIRQLIVNDDTQTQGSSGGSEAMRRQNNTFTIDTTGDPIYLYFNNAWQEPTNQCSGRVNVSGVLIDKCTLKGTGINMTVTPYKYSSENKLTQLARNADWAIDDGQIQHVRCEYSSAVAAGGPSPSGLTTITPDQACPTPVFSTDVTRVRLFSDVNGFKLSLGDDGFVRDVFLYLVRGDLTLANESNAETSFGFPNFRGVAWVNNLSMGSQCPKCAGGAFIAVPATTNYRRNDLFASDSQMETLLDYYRDVVARGITRTGLR
jgi:hypothetical protein